MRIVGGRLRGRALVGPTGDGIRQTSDRLRESLFNVLTHAYDDAVVGARVIDLFAGTGALGLEAMSRGAAYALLVDDGAAARGLIRQNVEALGLAGATRLFKRDATRMGPAAPNPPFNLVFCDPPYGCDLAGAALASCAEGGWLTQGALILVEEQAAVEIAWPPAFDLLERRVYGDSQVALARFTG
jgi:16S rRNA (guanine966-N2)-methyltransferase